MPEVQEACMKDLGSYCSHSIEKGQEIDCLQTNFEKLDERCRAVIKNFTEDEGQDYQLDQTLVKVCTGMVTKFCGDVVNRGESDGVLPCLIEHKNDPEMDEKCKASIEHWQLIELKDFTFSANFKKACRKDVEKLCPKAQNKHDVIKCLSKHVRDAVVEEQAHVVSEKCRKELHVAEEEEGENIKFDPELYGACTKDAETYCSDVTEGQAKVLECLKDNMESLSKECHAQVFEREKVEMQDPMVDWKLVKTCQKAIEHFCPETDPRDILKCLKEHKHEPEMDKRCLAIVTKRQKAQYENDELDPELHGACKRDIKKFCKNLSGHDMGQMMTCLKTHLDRLSEECEHYVRSVTREESLDYRLDPTLSKNCKTEINQLCSDVEPGKGRMEQCLRKHFGKIVPSSRCYAEVIRTMKEDYTSGVPK
ncbi:Golgi apparatus protein 1 [Exaiptasia diaphana]|nr:Golgi apparatus protein 1 [Exaiptasia diaphana]